MATQRVDIWNDNLYTDNYRLFFDEIDPDKPEKIILTKKDDDRNNAPNKWEFVIVDKEYIDEADQHLQNQIDIINEEIADDYCKLIEVEIDFTIPTVEWGNYRIEATGNLHRTDGSIVQCHLEGLMLAEPVNDTVDVRFQMQKTSIGIYGLATLTVVYYQGKAKMYAIVSRDLADEIEGTTSDWFTITSFESHRLSTLQDYMQGEIDRLTADTVSSVDKTDIEHGHRYSLIKASGMSIASDIDVPDGVVDVTFSTDPDDATVLIMDFLFFDGQTKQIKLQGGSSVVTGLVSVASTPVSGSTDTELIFTYSDAHTFSVVIPDPEGRLSNNIVKQYTGTETNPILLETLGNEFCYVRGFYKVAAGYTDVYSFPNGPTDNYHPAIVSHKDATIVINYHDSNNSLNYITADTSTGSHTKVTDISIPALAMTDRGQTFNDTQTFASAINMNGNRINNLNDPSAERDAVNFRTLNQRAETAQSTAFIDATYNSYDNPITVVANSLVTNVTTERRYTGGNLYIEGGFNTTSDIARLTTGETILITINDSGVDTQLDYGNSNHFVLHTVGSDGNFYLESVFIRANAGKLEVIMNQSTSGIKAGRHYFNYIGGMTRSL